MKHSKHQRDFDLEPLEPRILLSGDGVDLLLPSVPEAAEVVVHTPVEPDAAASEVDLEGRGLYSVIESSGLIVNTEGVWDLEGQQLADALAGLQLAADSVVIGDGVEAEDLQVTAGSIYVGEVQWSGGSTLLTDALTLGGQQEGTEGSVLTLAPRRKDAAISLGTEQGGFSLDSDALDRLSGSGIGEVVIGHADGSHTFRIDGLAYHGILTLRAPAEGGHFDVVSEVQHSGGALTFIGSGQTQNISADTITSGVPININDTLNLVENSAVTKTFGPNTIYLDTTDGGNAPAGANILITGSILGSGVGEGGVLYLNAGTGGDIRIDGDVGTTDPLDGLVIVNARNVTFNGNILLNFLNQQSGTGNTVFGDSASDTLALQTGDLTVLTENNVTFSGDVTSTSGGIEITVNENSVGTGKVHFKESVTLDDGNITIHSAKNVEFTKALDMNGDLLQTVGTQTTIFRGEIDADSITVSADLEIRFLDEVRLAVGDMTLTSNDVNFNGGAASIIGALDTDNLPQSNLFLRPVDATVSMDIGSPVGGVGTFQFTTIDIAALADGFSSIQFGYTSGSTNDLRLGNAVFTDPLSVYGGTLLVNGSLNAKASLLLEAAVGGIEVTNAQVRVSNDQIDNVWQNSVLTLTADQGDIDFTNGGSLRILNQDDADLTQGSNIFLTATTGSILNAAGSFGFVTGRNLTASAAGAITLLTEIKNLNATSTSSGDITVDELDDLLVTSAVTAAGSIAITSGGDTVVDLIQSQTDSADHDVTVEVFNGDLQISEVLAGTLGDITLTTEGALTGLSPQVLPHAVGNLLTLTAANGVGEGSVPLLINATALQVTNSATGAVVVEQIAGRTDLLASIDSDASGATDHVHLKVSGNLVVDAPGISSSSNAGIGLDVSSSLTVNGNVSGNGGLLSVSSGDDILLSTGVEINSGGGDLAVRSLAGAIQQAVDAQLISAGGHIIVSSIQEILLGIVDARHGSTPLTQTTWGDVVIRTQDAVSDHPGSGVTNIFARELTLSAQTGIGALDGATDLGLEVDADILAAETATGAVAVKDINDLTTGATSSIQLSVLNPDGTATVIGPISGLTGIGNGSGDILLGAGGTLTVTTADAVVTDGSGIVALVANAVSLEGRVQSAGGNLSITAVNDVTSTDDGDLLTSGAGTIGMSSSDGSILGSAEQRIATGSGSILLSAQGGMTLGELETTGAVGLRATTGSLLSADGGTDTRTVITADTLALVVFGVNGPALSSEPFRTEVNTLSLTGGTGAEFQIRNQGALLLDTTGASVQVYTPVLSPVALTLASQNDVDVVGEGNIGIDVTGGGLLVADGRTVRTTGAGVIVLTASGAFTMGTGGQVANENGTIDIDAGNTVSLSRVQSIDGDISIVSTTGSIVDSDPGESPVDLSTQGQLTLTAETGVGIESGDRQTLNVLLGTLAAATGSGGIYITSTDGFATNGLHSTVADASISIESGGDLTVGPDGSGIAVDATGDLIVLADGNLTQLANSSISATGDIRLSSGGTMTLEEVQTPGDVALTAVSVVSDTSTDTVEITADGVYLDQVGSLGTLADPLHVAISRLAGTVNDGTAVLENDGDLALGPVSVETVPTVPMGILPVAPFVQSGDRLQVDGVGEGLFVSITGALVVDAGTGAALTVSEALPVLLETTTHQTWNDAMSLSGGDLTLRAGGDLSFSSGGTSVTQGGFVSLEVTGDVSFSTTSGLDAGTGSLLTRAGGNVLLNGELISSQSVGILAGPTLSVSAIGGPAVRIQASDVLLRAETQIANGLFPVTMAASQLTAISGAGGVYVDNQGDLTITNLGFSVPSLQFDGTTHIAFSGHQGGVRTEQAGAISVNTTGTLTVQEVAAVVEAFPGTLNAISLVADETGPDGNTLNILFDSITSGSGGDPVTTEYTPETGLLTVTVRDGVSTLQEIVDAVNANADFAATAVLASGPLDGSQIFSLAPGQDFAFFAEGGRREGVLVGVSGTLEGGLEPVSATAQILLPGEFYNLLFTALNPGEAANAFQVRLLDDGPGGRLTDGADEAEVVWDEPNGNLDLFINFGVTTVGKVLTAVSDANTNDGVPFSVELDGFSVPSDLNDILGDSGVTLQSNLSAAAELRPTGADNDFQITATTSGQLFNQIETRFVDDGSVPSLRVRASFDDIENLLTVYIQSGTTTANEVLTAVDTEGTFTATLIQENGGGSNSGTGTLQANLFELHSGAVGVNATADLIMSGVNNDITLTADVPGADENGIQIALLPDAALPIGNATASYDAVNRILEVRLNSSFATAGNVISAINTAASGVLTASAAGSSAGGIELAAYPETAGGTGGPPEAVFAATGDQNDFELVADSNSPLLENIQVFLIDDGTITDGSATVSYLSGPRHLLLNVQSGVTTLSDLLSVLNADATVPVTGSLLAGNDGTGTFNIPAPDFLGGADPVKAQASTLLPSGTEILLEADDGGIAQNGIQVVYALNPSLVPGTAAANLFEVDGVRLLQIQVQSAAVSVSTLDQALTDAGLPFSVANLGAVGAEAVGQLSLRATGVQEGSLRLNAGDTIRLIGRLHSQTGPVFVTTQNAGDLTFDSETARIYALSAAEITLDGSFANLQSTESPLVKVFGEGELQILAEANSLESELQVLLQSGGDLTVGGTGGMNLNDQNLDVDAEGTITFSGPVDAGTGDVTLDAESEILFTSDGSLTGRNLILDAVDAIIQNGNITAVGAGTVDVTSTNGAITMGDASVTSSDTGTITYTADGNIGLTTLSSIGGDIVVTSGGAITDTHASNGTNLTTGGFTSLTAQDGLGSILTGDLKTQLADLQIRNLGTSGDIVITEQAPGGNLEITELTQQAVAGWSIVNVDNGDLTFSGPASHTDAGSLVLGVNGALSVQDTITLQGGNLTAVAFGDVTLEQDIQTTGGDASFSASGVLSLNPAMTLTTGGGNALLQASGNVLVSRVLAAVADVRIQSTGASVLRAAAGTSNSVTARALQLEAALSIGSLAAEDQALFTEVERLNANAAGGVIAVNESDDLLIGNSSISVEFAQINKSQVSGTFTESQFSTVTGAAVLQAGGNITVETISSLPTVSVDGNLHMNAGGTLTLQGNLEISNGSAQIVSGSDMSLTGLLDLSGGTLLIQSGGVFQQGAASVITVEDNHASIHSGGEMTLSRLDTGSGDLSLDAAASILVAAGAPSLQLSSSGLRLESGGTIGSVASPVRLAADTLSALATNSIHLSADGDLEVTAVGVTVNTVSTLGATSGAPFVQADLADVESTSGGHLLLQVGGTLTLQDGDTDAASVLTNGAGRIFVSANQLNAYADIESVDGPVSLAIAAAATWFTTPESSPGAGDGLAAKVVSTEGDLHLVVGAALTMQDQTLFQTESGDIYVETGDDLLVGSIQAPAGLAALNSGGAILDNGPAQTDVVADRLQILAADGVGILSPYDALDIDASVLSAQVTTGPLVLEEASAVHVGEVSGSVEVLDATGTLSATLITPLYGLQSLGGESVSVTAAGDLTVLSGGDPTDTEHGVSVSGTGNLFLQSSGGILTLNDSLMAGTGHMTLDGENGVSFAADVPVVTSGTGTLTVRSGNGPITQVAGSSLSALNGDIVLESEGTISLAELTTDTQISVRSTQGAILDNNGTGTNVTSTSLRLDAGLNIGTGLNPLNTQVDTLSAKTTNGAVYLQEADDLDIDSTEASTQVVSEDGTTVATPVAPLTGVTTGGAAGTIVISTPAGELNVRTGNEILASQAGNILLQSLEDLNLFSEVGSGTGTITLDSQADVSLDGGLEITTGGSGQIQIFSLGSVTTGAESRLVSVNGNIVIAAVSNVQVGGISTAGRAGITSLTGSIQGAGSTTFDFEAIASQFAVSAPMGGIGTLVPNVPVTAFRTQVGRLAAESGPGGIHIQNSISVTVDEVSITSQRVQLDGSLFSLPATVLSDLTTLSGNGSIVLRSTGGSVTLNEGGGATDGSVQADGTGNIRIEASQNITAQADVQSTSGHVTLRANGDIGINGDVSTSSSGTVYLRADTGSLTMAGTSTVSAAGSALILRASTDITLGNLLSDNAAVTSVNGSVLTATGSTMNFTGGGLRLVSDSDIGSASTPLTTDADTVSAVSNGGSIYLQEVDDLSLGTVGVTVQEVLLDASTTPVSETNLLGLTTSANNGEILVTSAGGGVTVNQEVSSHGSGNILLSGHTFVDVLTDILSTTGHLTVIAGNGLSLVADVDLTTGGTGSVYLSAGTGALTMNASSKVTAGGSLRLEAAGNVSVTSLTGQNVSILSSAGSIIRVGAPNLTVQADGLRLEAAGSIGTALLPLRTDVQTLTGSSQGGSIYLTETDDLLVTGVTVTTIRVEPDGTETSVIDEEQSDLSTGTNGSIILESLGGSITLNDGGDEDFLAVDADGSGNVRLQAAVNITVNSGVRSGTGHVTLLATGNVTAGPGVVAVTTAAPGTISVRAENGAVSMTGLTQITATDSSLRVSGAGDVTLGTLLADDVSILSTAGSVLNAPSTIRNITADRLRINAADGVGTAFRYVTTHVGTVSGRAGSGGIYLEELNALLIGEVTVTVSDVTSAGLLTPVTDAAQSDLRASGTGDLLLTTGDTLTLGAVAGDTVNLISAGAIVNNAASTPNVEATALLLNAELDIGAVDLPLTSDVDVLSAHSTTGNIFLADIGSVEVGSVELLTTPSNLADVQSNLETIYTNTVVLAAANIITLGRINSGTVALVAGDRVLKTPTSTLNVDAASLRIQAVNGVGAPGNFLITRVDTFAGSSESGDILISDNEGLILGSVTIPGLIPQSETLSGVTVAISGDVVILSDAELTVDHPVVTPGNIRLSADGELEAGTLTAATISLLSGNTVQHASGLITAVNLRVNTAGDVGSLTRALHTDVEVLSIVSSSPTGQVFVEEADDAALGTVGLTAGGVQDADQHGVEGPAGITLTSLAGGFRDGGDGNADLRSDGLATLTSVSGLGATGAGSLDLAVADLVVSNSGDGNIYLTLLNATDVNEVNLTGHGYLYVEAGGDLTVSGPVQLSSSGGAFLEITGILDLQDSLSTGRDIRIQASQILQSAVSTVSSTGGNIRIRTVSDYTMAPGAVMEALTGTVRVLSGTTFTIGLIEAQTVLLHAGGDLQAASTDRLTHQISGQALRLTADGAILPLLTDADRLDVQAGAVSEIYELDDLLIGRFGLRLVNESAGDLFTLRMNEAELGSADGIATIPGIGTFVWTSTEDLTLATRLVTDNGSILITAENLQQSGSLPGSYLDAGNGRVGLDLEDGAGTPGTNPITINAEELTADSDDGDQAYEVEGSVIITQKGINTATGTGDILIQVANGNLTQTGRIIHEGTGLIGITVPDGQLDVQAAGLVDPDTNPLIRSGGAIQLELDTGMLLTGTSRLHLLGSSFQAVTRTGNLVLQVTPATGTQSFLNTILIQEGVGNLDIRSSQALVALGNVRNLATGNLSLRAGTFISMAVGMLIRSETGALTLWAQELELTRVESFGSSTLFKATVFGVEVKPGSSGVNLLGDHRVRIEINTDILGYQINTPVDVFDVNTGNPLTSFSAGSTITYTAP